MLLMRDSEVVEPFREPQKNIEHRTSNIEHRTSNAPDNSMFGVRRWMFDVSNG
jgi:hypothetical protein